jgi:hypothetical protein
MSNVTTELKQLNKNMSTFLQSEPLIRDIHAITLKEIPLLTKRVDDLEEEAEKETRPKLQALRDDLMTRTGAGRLVALVAGSGLLGFLADRLW